MPRTGPSRPPAAVVTRLLLGLAAPAFLAVLSGCGERREGFEPRPGDLEVVHRFLEREPTVRLARDRSLRLLEVFDWRFDGREMSSWRVAGGGLVPVPGGAGIRIAGLGGWLTLVRGLGLEAASLDRLALVLDKRAGAWPSELILRWSGVAGGEAVGGEVVAGRGVAWDGPGRRFIFRLSGRPDWRGEISEIELRLEPPRGADWRLVSLTGLVQEAPGDRFANKVRSRVVLDRRFPPAGRAGKIWARSVVREAGGERSDEPWLALTHSGGFDARRIGGFRIELRGQTPADRRRVARLYWAGEGQEFVEERSVLAMPGEAAPPDGLSYDFSPRGHPEWGGEIRRLRLVCDQLPGELLGVARLTGYAEQPNRQALEEGAREGLEITLDSDQRSALAAIPDLPVERQLDLPRAARLRFAYGVGSGATLPLTFVVSAAVEGEEPEVLFEESLVTAGETGAWHDGDVDLGHLGGERVRLSLEVVGERPSGTLAIPAWAHPEVLAPARDARPPNVLLISVDTLRADRLSLYGHSRPTSPHLEAWAARRAAVFRNAVAQAPWTLPSHLSMLTGLNVHRLPDFRSIPASVSFLTELLRREGYTTAAVTGGGFLHPGFDLARGFDRFRYFPGRRREPGGEGEAAVEDELELGLENVLALLEEIGDRPFFVLFHTYEVHMPHVPREPYFSRFSEQRPLPILKTPALASTAETGFVTAKGLPEGLPSEVDARTLLEDLYDSGVAYTDEQLGRLLGELEASGLADRTVVVVTSDHGELLGEGGLTGHNYLDDENLMVPLLIADPSGRGAGEVIVDQVRLVDLFPTLLELTGVATPGDGPPSAAADGASLVPLLEGERGLAPEGAWTYAGRANRGLGLRLGNRFKYVYNDTAWSPVHGRERLTRLTDDGTAVEVEDPEELARFRRSARELLTEEAHGLRLSVRNDAAGELGLDFRGSMVSEKSVKSLDPSCPCLDWLGPGTARLELPPDGSTTLRFHVAEPLPLELSIRRDGRREARRIQLSPAELLAGGTVSVEEGEWRKGALAPADLAPAVTYWWIGGRTSAGAGAETTDVELRQRLEALGYID